jgi:hypothetical protein
MEPGNGLLGGGNRPIDVNFPWLAADLAFVFGSNGSGEFGWKISFFRVGLLVLSSSSKDESSIGEGSGYS